MLYTQKLFGSFRSPVKTEAYGAGPALPESGQVSAFGQDHDVCSLDERRRLHPGFETKLVGALAGYEGHQVDVPDPQRHFGRGLSFDDLRDSVSVCLRSRR